ncbi:MAG: sodium:solute symporter family protein [Thermodesulfobacteriota bacterium]|nr:sodium:solute symporter family protein [Thermodesulfobacteriota bacterium]
MMTVFILAAFGLLVLLLAVYGYKVSAKTAEDYMLAGRGIGIAVMFFFALFAISSVWTFYAYPSILYRHGPGFVYFIWGCVAGFVVLYMFIGPRLWAVCRLNRFLSPIEALSARYESPALRLLLSLVLLGSVVPYIADQSLGVGLGLKALLGFPPFVGILYISLLLILIVLLGGMRITAWVNVILGLLYTLAFLGSLVFVVVKVFPGGLSEAVSILQAKQPALLFTPGPQEKFLPHVTCIVFMLGILAFTWPHIVVSTMTAQDKTIFKWMPALALIVAGMLFYTIPFIWGAVVAPAISHMPGSLVPPVSGKAADNIVQTIVTSYLPPWFSTFVLMGVIAAAISTAAVQLMTASIIVARDIIHGVFVPRGRDQFLIRTTKLSVIAILLMSMGIAFWYPVELARYLLDLAIPGFAQWGPALVGGILWKRATKKGALAGTVAGSVYLVAGFIHKPLLLGLPPAIPTILVNLILFVVISLLTSRPSEKVIRVFFDEVEDFLSKKA